MQNEIKEVQNRLGSSQRVTVLTGAGISADSGVPTFRGPDGLWRNFRAEELATPEAFVRDPVLVWEWYNWRRELISSKKPNPAHHTLAALESRISNFSLLTQNVDGLHGLAGSQRIVELHGNIWKVRCTGCGQINNDRRVPIPIPPYCPSCQRMLRPHIVWFGEMLDPKDMEQAMKSLESCDTLLVIGTSGVVQPTASFASIAKSAGAFVVEINPDASASVAHLALRGKAAEVVPQLA
ncbi:MAG TPA: NAD-dependent deacylase [Nitrospiria bacterium]|jgi:NAD-dependent deacetylase